MRISSIFNNTDHYNKVQNKSQKQPEVNPKPTDSINLSDDAKDFQTTLKSLSNTDDIREDKVNSILQKIQSGNYNISAEDIANRIMQD